MGLSAYNLFPETNANGQGRQFESQSCRSILLISRYQTKIFRRSSHNVFGVIEAHHQFQREIYGMVLEVNQTVLLKIHSCSKIKPYTITMDLMDCLQLS